MNSIERYLYNMVKHNAPLKRKIVVVYQALFSILGRFKGKIWTNRSIVASCNGFFGFHDRHSLTGDGKLLGHKEVGAFKEGQGSATIGYYLLGQKVDEFFKVAETPCCNYQQGSMACWYTSDAIMYNDMDNGDPQTTVRSLDGRVLLSLPFHFFSLSPCRRMVTAINFHRFGKGMPGYGYNVEFGAEFDQDGEVKMSTSGLGDLVIHSIEDSREVARVQAVDAKSRSKYLLDLGYEYFSHTGFSHDSRYVYFLYRASDEYRNSSQLFVLDIRSSKLLVLPTRGMVSHLDWLDGTTILAYCNVVGHRDDGYYSFNLLEEDFGVKPVKFAESSVDGHPHCSRQSPGIFYTDCYPNRERRQSLYRVDARTQQSETILTIYSPIKYKGVQRVDLHPRLSECERYLTIDTSYLGCRSQLVLAI